MYIMMYIMVYIMYNQGVLLSACLIREFFSKIFAAIAAKLVNFLIVRCLCGDNKLFFVAAKLPLLPLGIAVELLRNCR